MSDKHKLFVISSFCSYFVLALPFTIQGSNAPVTMEYYGITAAQQGLIITMQSVGSLCTAIFIALKGEKYNKINSIALGLLIICLTGLVIAGAPAYAVLLLVIVLVGIGVTFIDIMMNGVIADVYTQKKNTLLPLAHAFFSVGATVTPIIVTSLANPASPISFTYPFRVSFILAGAVFVLYFLSSRRIMPDTPYIDMEAMKKRAVENPAEIFKFRESWFYFVVGLLYFTFQLGTIIWLPTFAIRHSGVDFETGGLMLTAFFAGSLLMRFISPLFLKKLTPRQVYMYFGWAAAAFMLAALFTGNTFLMIFFVAACGFFQGSNVATLVLMCCDAFPERTASASSIYSLSSGIASLTAPFWMGALSGITGFLLPMILISLALAASATMVFAQKEKTRQ